MEMIHGMGETRTGDEHTAADDARWQEPRAEDGTVLVVDLDVWTLTGAKNGALFFTKENGDTSGVLPIEGA